MGSADVRNVQLRELDQKEDLLKSQCEKLALKLALMEVGLLSSPCLFPAGPVPWPSVGRLTALVPSHNIQPLGTPHKNLALGGQRGQMMASLSPAQMASHGPGLLSAMRQVSDWMGSSKSRRVGPGPSEAWVTASYLIHSCQRWVRIPF